MSLVLTCEEKADQNCIYWYDMIWPCGAVFNRYSTFFVWLDCELQWVSLYNHIIYIYICVKRMLMHLYMESVAWISHNQAHGVLRMVLLKFKPCQAVWGEGEGFHERFYMVLNKSFLQTTFFESLVSGGSHWFTSCSMFVLAHATLTQFYHSIRFHTASSLLQQSYLFHLHFSWDAVSHLQGIIT